MVNLTLAAPGCRMGHAWLRVGHVLAPSGKDDGTGVEIETRGDQDVICCGRCSLVSIKPAGLRAEIQDFARHMQNAMDAHAPQKGESWRQDSAHGHAENVKRKAFALLNAVSASDHAAARVIAADLANEAWMTTETMRAGPAPEVPS